MKLPPLPPKVIIPVAQRMPEQFGIDTGLCPKCKKGRLVLVGITYPKVYEKPVSLAAGIHTQAALHNKDRPPDSGRASP